MTSNLFHKKFPLLDASIMTPGNQYEYDEAIVKVLSNQYRCLLDKNREYLSDGSVYLNSNLHDSWVESVEVKEDSITIWMNDFQTHCFSDAVCDYYKISVPHKKRVFPIGVQLNRIKSSSIFWINKNNKLIPLNQKKYLSKLSEFLFDEVQFIGINKIQIGFLFMTSCNTFSNKKTVLFQVECKNITFLDRQKDSFQNLFSERYASLFDEFWAKRLCGENFDLSNSMKLIEKTEQLHAGDG